MTKRDYYEVLGVDRNATIDSIKKSYRQTALKYHPDRNPGDASSEDKFKEAAEAYSVLSDTEKRRRYDQFGHAGVRGTGAGGADFASSIFSDLFGSIFDEFDIFGGRGNRRGQTRARRGADYQYELTISLKESLSGKAATIQLEKPVTCKSCSGSGQVSGAQRSSCPSCQGRGQIQQQQGFFSVVRTCPHCGGAGTIITDPCQDCRGNGRTVETKKIQLKVPPGIDTGQRLRVSGEGEPGTNSGPPGDLYVLVRLEDDHNYKRDGKDLHTILPISFSHAALGAERQIELLDERQVKVKIPAGSQSGDVVPLRGEGMPDLQGYGKGDLYCHLQLVTPKKLSPELRKHFEEIARLEGDPKITSHKNVFERFRQYFQ